MANDAIPVKASPGPLVRGTPPAAATAITAGGKTLPSGAPKPVPSSAQAATTAKPLPDLHVLVAQLNKHLQNSGRPNHYKLDSSSGHRVIQEIDPDTSKVVSEIPASEFKALAQSLGVSGLLLDAHA